MKVNTTDRKSSRQLLPRRRKWKVRDGCGMPFCVRRLVELFDIFKVCASIVLIKFKMKLGVAVEAWRLVRNMSVCLSVCQPIYIPILQKAKMELWLREVSKSPAVTEPAEKGTRKQPDSET